MLIITIGRNPDNKIVINDPSEKVGREHAEILIRPDGYMTLKDNNSVNGTTLKGQRIQSGQEIPINRGDKIFFARTHALDWNQVPTPPDFSKYSRIISIGRERDNQILISDNRISRYHALVLIDKKNKYFLYDQSTTGTTINGRRVPPNVPVPVKRGEKVGIANSELDWSKVPKLYCPLPSFVHRLCKISLCFKGVASILMHNTWRRAV